MINKDEFETYLSSLIAEDYIVEKAMNYSLLARSKRLRPLLLLNCLKDFDFPYQQGFCCGATIEMIHTYSLIHDDLPAFDNDDLRRGKPTCHKAFDEETAILAGDALLTFAFENICNGLYSAQQKVELIKYISSSAGKDGMIKGQSLDKSYEGKTVQLEQLIEMDELKTARLLSLPLICAAIIADKKEYIPLFKEVGNKLGIAFQIQDDILDLSAGNQLGKSTSDLKNKKSTYISLLSMDKAQNYVRQLFAEINTILDQDSLNFANSKELINSLINRTW